MVNEDVEHSEGEGEADEVDDVFDEEDGEDGMCWKNPPPPPPLLQFDDDAVGEVDVVDMIGSGVVMAAMAAGGVVVGITRVEGFGGWS